MFLSFNNNCYSYTGAHTIGQARCLLFRTHIYNESNIDTTFNTSLKASCPSVGGDSTLLPLDVAITTRFDKNYYSDLTSEKATGTNPSNIGKGFKKNPNSCHVEDVVSARVSGAVNYQ